MSQSARGIPNMCVITSSGKLRGNLGHKVAFASSDQTVEHFGRDRFDIFGQLLDRPRGESTIDYSAIGAMFRRIHVQELSQEHFVRSWGARLLHRHKEYLPAAKEVRLTRHAHDIVMASDWPKTE